MRRLSAGYGEMLDQHNRVLREVFAAHQGHAVDTQGYSFLVAFARAQDAVAAAVAGQRALAAAAWPSGATVRVRMGIHTTEPGVRSDGYHGLGVVRGARICASGHGGQVLLSAATHALIADQGLEGVGVVEVGVHRLKGMEQPERIYQLRVTGLTSSFPPLRTATVERDVVGRAGELAAAAEAAVQADSGSSGFSARWRCCATESSSQSAARSSVCCSRRSLSARTRWSPPTASSTICGAPHRPAPQGTSLQNFVSILRKVLGADAVVTQPPGYVL